MRTMLGNGFVKILDLFKKSLEMEIVDTALVLVHEITQKEHLVSIYVRLDQLKRLF